MQKHVFLAKFLLTILFFSLLNSSLLFFSAKKTLAQGTFDCRWGSTAPGNPPSCHTANHNCDPGYSVDFDHCGQLTPQGEDVCEDPSNQGLSCVSQSTDECTGVSSGEPGTCYTTTLCPEGTLEDGVYPTVCTTGGRCCITPQTECQSIGGECRTILHGVCPGAFQSEPIGPAGSLGCSATQHCCIPNEVGCYPVRPWPLSSCREGDVRCTYDLLRCCMEEASCPSPRPSGESRFFCNPGDASSGIDTAIGCMIFTNMSSFTQLMLLWLMGIGGGIAFLLMIFAGFILMTSAGNPEKLAQAKAIFVSALSGLLFIIFSVFLLRVIGVNILRIPGM